MILGILLFSYLLLYQIRSIPNEDVMIPLTESRPESWQIYRIYMIIIIMNCITAISRIICSVFIFQFRKSAVKISLRCKYNFTLNSKN